MRIDLHPEVAVGVSSVKEDIQHASCGSDRTQRSRLNDVIYGHQSLQVGSSLSFSFEVQNEC